MQYRLDLERRDIIELWEFLKSTEWSDEFDLLNKLEDFFIDSDIYD